MTNLAYHHYEATPLTFRILTGKFETIPILLAAGAQWDIPNSRGKTPVPVSRREMTVLNEDESSDINIEEIYIYIYICI